MIRQHLQLLIFVLIVTGLAFWGGYRFGGTIIPHEITNTAALDSLLMAVTTLEDSLKTLVVANQKTAVGVGQNRIAYDTVYVRESVSDVILGLRQIANTPPR